MHVIVHPADVQDRDGGVLLISTSFGLYPFLRKLFADGGYQGAVFEKGAVQFLTRMDVEIVKRSDSAKGFVVLPRRWMRLSQLPCSGVCTLNYLARLFPHFEAVKSLFCFWASNSSRAFLKAFFLSRLVTTS